MRLGDLIWKNDRGNINLQLPSLLLWQSLTCFQGMSAGVRSCGKVMMRRRKIGGELSDLLEVGAEMKEEEAESWRWSSTELRMRLR